jgi:hypothetical protein
MLEGGLQIFCRDTFTTQQPHLKSLTVCFNANLTLYPFHSAKFYLQLSEQHKAF